MRGSSDQSAFNTTGWWRHHLPAPLGWEISSCPCCSLECSGDCLYDSGERDRQRESCVSQMMTGGIKAPRGAILSPVQSALMRKMCMSAFWRAMSRQRKWCIPLPAQGLNVKLSPLCELCPFFYRLLEQIQHWSELGFELSVAKFYFHSLSKHIETFCWNPPQDSYAPFSVVYHANLQQDFLLVMVLRHTHACMQLHILSQHGKTDTQ